MDSLPTEIHEFIGAIRSLGGTESVEPSKWYLPDIPLEQLSLPAFGDLPLAVLRRSGGAVGEELLICLVIRPQRNAQGWRTVEFLSWWVRDVSRAGTQVQIRSIALPPQIGGQVQLGQTLRFVIEFFWRDDGQDMQRVLCEFRRLANSLARSQQLYANALTQAAP